MKTGAAYTIHFERNRDGVLRALVAGVRSLPATIGYWEAILGEIAKGRPTALMVMDELVGEELAASEWKQLVEAMAGHDAPEHTKLWAMVETPYAMLHAEEIAAASDRLTVLVMGTNDLAKELYAEHVPGRQPLLTGLGLALLAARATGKAIIDGVYNDVKDAEGFLAECRQGREMGFDGKTLIHPGQVEGANEAFAPSEQAVEDARGILQAWEDGKGSGVVTYNGRMVENLHVESARRTLSIHEAIRALSAG